MNTVVLGVNTVNNNLVLIIGFYQLSPLAKTGIKKRSEALFWSFFKNFTTVAAFRIPPSFRQQALKEQSSSLLEQACRVFASDHLLHVSVWFYRSLTHYQPSVYSSVFEEMFEHEQFDY